MKDNKQWIIDWFKRQAPHIKLEIDENYFAAGAIDSMGIIELIEEMEQYFSVRFSQDDFQDERFSCIGGLTEMLAEKLAL
jgi:acyl carrier protein